MAVSTGTGTGGRARIAYFDEVTTQPVVFNFDAAVKSATVRRVSLPEIRNYLANAEVEVALIPGPELAYWPGLSLIPTAGISVVGPSNLYVLASKVLPGEINRVLVDAEDYGCTPLAQLVMSQKLRVRPEFFRSEEPLNPAEFDFREDPHDAFLLAGINALVVRRQAFAWSADLTQAWHEATGLPFVIHAWVCKRGQTLGTLDKDLGELGRRNASDTTAMAKKQSEILNLPAAALEQFYTRTLRMSMGPQEITSIRRYMKELSSAQLLDGQPMLTIYQPPTSQRR